MTKKIYWLVLIKALPVYQTFQTAYNVTSKCLIRFLEAQTVLYLFRKLINLQWIKGSAALYVYLSSLLNKGRIFKSMYLLFRHLETPEQRSKPLDRTDVTIVLSVDRLPVGVLDNFDVKGASGNMDDRLKTSPPRRKQIGAKGFNFIYFFFFFNFFFQVFFSTFLCFFL